MFLKIYNNSKIYFDCWVKKEKEKCLQMTRMEKHLINLLSNSNVSSAVMLKLFELFLNRNIYNICVLKIVRINFLSF